MMKSKFPSKEHWAVAIFDDEPDELIQYKAFGSEDGLKIWIENFGADCTYQVISVFPRKVKVTVEIV